MASVRSQAHPAATEQKVASTYAFSEERLLARARQSTLAVDLVDLQEDPSLRDQVRAAHAAGVPLVVLSEQAFSKQACVRLQDQLQELGLPRLPVTNVQSPEFASLLPEQEKQATVAALPNPDGTVTPIPIDPAWTGPAAIEHALKHLDIAGIERDANEVLRRKLKSKRPAAVERLGFLDGMKRTGIKPEELMISRVPVIPPMFRPFSMAGSTFVPGDANELYRDLINLLGTHQKLEQRLGGTFSGENRLKVYDAVKAVYGHGEPVVPKTKERGVSGYLKQLTGVSPKYSLFQRKLIAHDQDFTGRATVTLNPKLSLDQVGIPDEMAWKIYGPYIQRRLVRSGMMPVDALRHITDRSSYASKHLDLEMKERPVMYSRAPAWHKYNILGGWAVRTKGSSIDINPLVGTGGNTDHDGDQMNVHVVSTPDAVRDVKEKIMPSKMLFSIKERGAIVPVPKHEYLLGIHGAQTAQAQRKHVFPDEASALAAIKSNQVSLSDDVEIAGQPATR